MDRRSFITTVSQSAVGLAIASSLHGTDKINIQNRSCVIRTVDDQATCDSFIDTEVVQTMVDESIKALTGRHDVVSAWHSILPDIRLATDVIGIKVNCINASLQSHPEVVYAIVNGLKRIGVPENNILIWDRGNNDLMRAGYTINESQTGVRCFGSGNSGGVDYDPMPYSVYDDICYLSRIVTEYSTYLINVSCLKASGVYGAGVTLCLKNHYGSISMDRNFYAGPGSGKLHNNFCNPYIPALNALTVIRKKQVLCVCDALFGNHINNLDPPTFTYNGILMGEDPVAIDRVGVEVLKENGFSYSDSAVHISTAAKLPYNLGNSNPNLIDIIEINNPSSSSVDSTVDYNGDLPDKIILYANYPNPFNPETAIPFSLPQTSQVRLDILSTGGRCIRTLATRSMPAGNHLLSWDGTDKHGRTMPSGTYIYRLTSGDITFTRKMMKVK